VAQSNDTLQTESELKRGLYLSLEELYNNNPSITDSFFLHKTEREKEVWKGTYSYRPEYKGPRKKVKKMIGFCDGEQRFIFHNGEFFEIVKDGKEYSFWGYGTVDEYGSDEGKAVSYLLLGVVLGEVVHNSIQESNMQELKVNYVLEPSNGKIYSRESYKKVGVRLAIYRKKRKEIGEAVNITINDTIEYSLIPNSYYDPIFKFNGDDIKICIEGQVNCIVIKPDSIMTKYIKISNLKEVKEIKLEEVNWDQGEYEVIVPLIFYLISPFFSHLALLYSIKKVSLSKKIA